MNKKIQRITGSYYLRGSGINNNRYGWFNESTNEWEIDPIYDYYYAINFDFVTYLKEMKKLKQVAINRAMKSKKFKKNLRSSYNANLASIQSLFGVALIKHACDNYDDAYCYNSSNINCMRCPYRFNNIEKIEGGNNE